MYMVSIEGVTEESFGSKSAATIRFLDLCEFAGTLWENQTKATHCPAEPVEVYFLKDIGEAMYDVVAVFVYGKEQSGMFDWSRREYDGEYENGLGNALVYADGMFDWGLHFTFEGEDKCAEIHGESVSEAERNANRLLARIEAGLIPVNW